MASRLADVELSPRKYCVLSGALGEELPQIRLAEASMLDKTTMVVTLDELEQAGLAEGCPSPRARHALILPVPQKGESSVPAAGLIVEQMQQELLATVPEASRQAFLRALEQLVAGPLASPSHVDRSGQRPRERAMVPN